MSAQRSIPLAIALAALIVVLTGPFHLRDSAPAGAAETAIVREYIDPIPSFSFTQVVTATANGVKTIQVSGQIGRGENHAEQTEAACRSVLARLEKAGATERDVVKIVIYIKDMDQDAVQGVREGKDKVFLEENQPAATWVGVTGLVSEWALVEIEAVAMVSVND